MKKRIVSALLAIAMVMAFSSIPDFLDSNTAQAAESFSFTYPSDLGLTVMVSEVGVANPAGKTARSSDTYAFEVLFTDASGNQVQPSKPVRVVLPFEYFEAPNMRIFQRDGDKIVVLDKDNNNYKGVYVRAQRGYEFSCPGSGIYSLKENAVSFTDIDDYSYEKFYIEYMAAREIIKGTGAGMFTPAANLTRGQFAAFIYRMLDMTDAAPASSPFKDVPKTHMFYKEICGASKYGFILGYDGKYTPDGYISRQDAILILSRVYEPLSGVKSDIADFDNIDTDEIRDLPAVSDYARAAVGTLYKQGYFLEKGYATLNPKDNITRAECAFSMGKVYFCDRVIGNKKYEVGGLDNTFTGKTEGDVKSFAAVYGSKKSEEVSLKVNGTDVYVEDYRDFNIARFSFTKDATVEFTTSVDMHTATVSPLRLGYDVAVSGNKAEFTMTKPSKAVVNLGGGLKKLLVLAYEHDNDIPDKKACINVISSGADPTGVKDSTMAFQSALTKSGKTVYIPRGKYLVKPLYISSNVNVYFEDGAVLYTSNDQKLYLNQSRKVAISLGIFNIEKQSNIKIYGYGVIDNSGVAKRALYNDKFNCRNISTNGAKNVTIMGLMSRDSGGWNTHLYDSDNITIDNYTIINSFIAPMTDGIDPDASRNVTINNCFIYCEDDAIAWKTVARAPYNTPENLPPDSYDIVVTNNVLLSGASAIKLGTESRAKNMYNFRAKNNDILIADRAIQFAPYDNSFAYDILLEDTFVERVQGITKNRAFGFFNTEDETRVNTSKLEDLTLKNVTIYRQGWGPSIADQTDDQRYIKGITLENIVIAGKRATSVSDIGFEGNVAESAITVK